MQRLDQATLEDSVTFEELSYRSSNGLPARFYVRAQFKDLFRTFFDDVSSELTAQESDVVPLHRGLRKYALRLLLDACERKAHATWGASSSSRGGVVRSRRVAPALKSRQDIRNAPCTLQTHPVLSSS